MYQTCGLAFDHPELPKIMTVYSDISNRVENTSQSETLGCVENRHHVPCEQESVVVPGQNPSTQPSKSQDAISSRNSTLKSNKDTLSNFILYRRQKLMANELRSRLALHDSLKERYGQLPRTHTHTGSRRAALHSVVNHNYLTALLPNHGMYHTNQPPSRWTHDQELLIHPQNYGTLPGFRYQPSNFQGHFPDQVSERFFSLLSRHKSIDWQRVYDGAKLLLRPRYDAKLPVTRQEVLHVMGCVIEWLHGNTDSGVEENRATPYEENHNKVEYRSYMQDYRTKMGLSSAQTEVFSQENCYFSDINTNEIPDRKQVPQITTEIGQSVISVKQEPSDEAKASGCCIASQSVDTISPSHKLSIASERSESFSSLFETLETMDELSSLNNALWETENVFDGRRIKEENPDEILQMSKVPHSHSLVSTHNDDIVDSLRIEEREKGKNLRKMETEISQGINWTVNVNNVKEECSNIVNKGDNKDIAENNVKYNIFEVLDEL